MKKKNDFKNKIFYIINMSTSENTYRFVDFKIEKTYNLLRKEFGNDIVDYEIIPYLDSPDHETVLKFNYILDNIGRENYGYVNRCCDVCYKTDYSRTSKNFIPNTTYIHRGFKTCSEKCCSATYNAQLPISKSIHSKEEKEKRNKNKQSINFPELSCNEKLVEIEKRRIIRPFPENKKMVRGDGVRLSYNEMNRAEYILAYWIRREYF